MFTVGHRINVGRKYTKERNLKVSLAKRGPLNPAWKGGDVGYKSLHIWVRGNLIEPKCCPACGSTKKLDLSNKSHKYLRSLDDWQWLCRSCHRKYDGAKPRSWLGLHHSEETRKKISELKRLWWLNKRMQRS